MSEALIPGYVLVRRLTRHHRNARVGREPNRWSSWHRTNIHVGRNDDYVRTGRQYEPVRATGWNRFGGDGFSWKRPEGLTSSAVRGPLDVAPQHDHGPCRMAGRRRGSLIIAVAPIDLADHKAIAWCDLYSGWPCRLSGGRA